MPLLLNLVEESLHALVLHRVLDWAQEVPVHHAIANGNRFGVGDHGVAEFIIDVFVDVDALQRNADLPGVQEGEGRNLRGCFGYVYAFADDCWVFSSSVDSSVCRIPFEGGQGNLSYSSRVTRLSVLAALSITFFPVAVEPVKEILSTPGWAVSHGPRLSSPLRAWTTPGGKKFWASSASLRPQYGVNGLGLMMIQFPVKRAGAIFPQAFYSQLLSAQHGERTIPS